MIDAIPSLGMAISLTNRFFSDYIVRSFTSQETGMVPHFVTLGLFIIDEFEYLDDQGNQTGRSQQPQIGGGGTYSAIGARICKIGMIVDRGMDFPQDIQQSLDAFGKEMWLYRDNPDRMTTRAINSYRGDNRGFNYITPRRRLTPTDLRDTRLERPANLHFICSPSRAIAITSEVLSVPDWKPLTVYEPIPDRCVPEELASLIAVLPHIDILSPNSDEALSLLSMRQPSTKETIEEACSQLLKLGVGTDGMGYVIIRSGALGAYVASRAHSGRWVDAYWSAADAQKVVDVTGAGNSFLGGLSAGLLLTNGDVMEAVKYAAVSASFTIEQLGLPRLTKTAEGMELWNNDNPSRRLEELRARHSM